MLWIKAKDGRGIEWHVNEPVPDIQGRVVEFQADGHELELIFRAMEQNFDYGRNHYTIGGKGASSQDGKNRRSGPRC
jgi:hypothetical protein